MVLYKIKSSYKDLINIKQGSKPYSISQIEWWLMKYYEFYKQCKKSNNQYCQKCEKAIQLKLPTDCLLSPKYCVKSNEVKEFITFYDTLDEITQVHRLSNKCYMVYEDYSFSVCTDEDCTEWTVKHYNLWTQLHYFFYNYVEDEQEFIEIQEIPNTNIQLIINKEDFRIIEGFYSAYHEAYYIKDLYPEKRHEIELKMNSNEKRNS